jgi:flagellin-like protein
MNQKGITPIIAIILLLMMTVAVAGAAFFWLSRIQNQLQGGVESYQGTIFTQMASSIDVVDADYNNSNTYLTMFFRNTGNSKVPVSNSTTYPTTTWILKDFNQVAICSSTWTSTSAAKCTEGCDDGGDLYINVGEIHKVVLDLNGACDISAISHSSGTLFSFTVDFSGKTTASASFVKP